MRLNFGNRPRSWEITGGDTLPHNEFQLLLFGVCLAVSFVSGSLALSVISAVVAVLVSNLVTRAQSPPAALLAIFTGVAAFVLRLGDYNEQVIPHMADLGQHPAGQSQPDGHLNNTGRSYSEGAYLYFRRRLSAEGAKPESNNRWKSDLGHVCMYVCGYVWYLELSREPIHIAQQTRHQNVGLRNGHCLGTVSLVCNF